MLGVMGLVVSGRMVGGHIFMVLMALDMRLLLLVLIVMVSESVIMMELMTLLMIRVVVFMAGNGVIHSVFVVLVRMNVVLVIICMVERVVSLVIS